METAGGGRGAGVTNAGPGRFHLAVARGSLKAAQEGQSAFKRIPVCQESSQPGGAWGAPWVTAGKMLACVCSSASSAHIGNALTACVRVGKVRKGRLCPHLGSKRGVATAPGRHELGCS